MTALEQLLPAKQMLKSQSHLTFRGNVHNGRYGWLRLTPAYSLGFVERILTGCTEDDLVLDPFSGTGTTVLASSVCGVRAHAVDINPFLVWLGNLKSTRFPKKTEADLTLSARRVSELLQGNQRDSGGAWVPDIHQIEKWWDAETLTFLAQLRTAICDIESEFGVRIADLLRVAFCQVMIGQAHVSFGHQSMSFKKAASNGSSRRQQLTLFSIPKREELLAAFMRAVKFVASGVIENQPRSDARVFLGDSRILTQPLPLRSYTKVITSPPYPNRMSYVRELRPYMYWLGYLFSGRQAGELDWAAIGGTWGCATSNLGAWEPDPRQPIPFPDFEAIVNSIAQDHRLLGKYVHRYFEDIAHHVGSLRAVLSPGAKCFYVIGNSKFYGTMLPAQDIYAAILEASGFQNLHVTKLRKRNSKKELFEYVVYAEAP